MCLIIGTLLLLVSFTVSENLPGNIFLDAVEQVKYFGYPIEIHHVTTEDGYILELHRIPHGLNNTEADNKTVAVFMPGILCSSGNFFIYGSEKSLPYILANLEYDVWVANWRGSHYSRKHVTLDPDVQKAQFFNFSFHEIGIYDLPAIIDYVLNTTGQEDLFYIGHSMGTTSFLTMSDASSDYYDKVRLAVFLAPVSYGSHVPQPAYRLGAHLRDIWKPAADTFGVYELLPKTEFSDFLAPFCVDESPFQSVCFGVASFIVGWDTEQFNTSILPLFLSVAPAGVTVKILDHYSQIINSGKFRKYDYGLLGNIVEYGQAFPPDYALENVSAPVALYYGSNDYFASVIDVEQLASELPNVAKKYLVPYEYFNHLDFLYAKQINELLYDDVIQMLTEY